MQEEMMMKREDSYVSMDQFFVLCGRDGGNARPQ